MSRIIVVSGARSHVGKTTLARQIARLLPGAVRVKIGHGEKKDNDDGVFYHFGTPAAQVMADHAAAPFLVVESNSFLLETDADLIVYLDADNPKPSALAVRERAQIVRGKRVSEEVSTMLAARLGCSVSIVRRIAWLAGARPSPVGALILAGGKSSRMGRDKAFLDAGAGMTMVSSLVSQLRLYADRVRIVTRYARMSSFERFETVFDEVPDLGPLGAICSGLAVSEYDTNIVVACDVPRLDPQVISGLLSESDDHAIAIPTLPTRGDQPLCGVYKREVLPIARALLQGGQRRIRDLLDRCATVRVTVEDESWYANLNTPHEYRSYMDALHSESR